MLNKNKIETFKTCDKAEILKAEGEVLYDDIVSGAVLEDPSRLAPFVLLSHAVSFAISNFKSKLREFQFQDLKSYNFYYWFAFVSSIDPILYETSPAQKISQVFSESNVEKLTEVYKNVEDQRQLAFFVCNKDLEITYLKDAIRCDDLESNFKEADFAATYFCFSDPSGFENPGWPLRNYILMLLKLCPNLSGQQINVLAVRQDEQRTLKPSLIFKVDLKNVGELDKSSMKWTGWERNKQGKLLPKMALMGEVMDPVMESEHFAKLNLKLMKWRLLPNLDLEKISAQKCLIFGAGTLGCAIARNLLSWGVSEMTFIDCGNVGLSNPVRQSLFTNEDAAKKRPKATTAADRLKEILPSVKATGHVFQIPMPGHSISESMRAETLENIEKISTLIQSHDVLFLVTDSRESRWLPTLLGAFYGKVISSTDITRGIN